MSAHQSVHHTCEALIRAGQVPDAIRVLKQINTNQVEREWRLPLANLCRRVRLLEMGLRLLKPIVRSEAKLDLPASHNELAEYALLLERFGSTAEALKLLEGIDFSRAPEAYFSLASCMVAQWQYEDAITPLVNFVTQTESDYSRLIGRVNLAAALLFARRTDEALDTIQECLAQANEHKAFRLMANVLELRAQAFIRQSEFAQARADLEQAAAILFGSTTRDQLYIRKWQSVLLGYEQNDVRPLQSFKREAALANDFETVRDADFHILKNKFEPGLFNHLYFGTPWEAYRAYLRRELGRKPESANYIWGDSPRVLNLATGESNGEPLGLKPGKTTHRLLDLLSRDFYSPLRVGGVFAHLWPQEYFDIHSSPGRVRQAIARARKEAGQAGLQLEIKEFKGRYSLRPVRVSLCIELERGVLHPFQPALNKLRTQFGDAIFSGLEARRALGFSYGNMNRLLNWILDSGHGRKLGQGPQTLYVLKAQSAKETLAA